MPPAGDFRGHPRGGSCREVAVEVFRAQLQADLRAATKIHRPLVTIGLEANSFEHRHGSVDLFDGDDKIDITGHHRLSRPMVHRNAPDGAPMQFSAFQRIDHPHHVP